MTTDSNTPDPSGQKQPSFGFAQLVWAGVLLLVLLLLGQSMVKHRFFQGQRSHQNGSVGQ